MSRRFTKKPKKGVEIAGMWQYVMVNVDHDIMNAAKWCVFELSKHKTYKDARAAADQSHANALRYAKERGYSVPRREYYVAEWTVNTSGDIVLVLIDDVE